VRLRRPSGTAEWPELPAACTAVWLSWRAGPVLTLFIGVLSVAGGLLPAVAVSATGSLIDAVVAGATGTARSDILVLAACGLLTATVPALNRFLLGEASRRMDAILQDEVFASLNRLHGIAMLERPDFRDKLHLAQQSTGGALAPASLGLWTIAQDVVRLVSITGILLVISPALALLLFLSGIPAVAVERAMSKRRISVVGELTPAVRRQFFFTQLVLDLRAAKEIRLLGLGNSFRGLAAGELSTVHAGQRRLAAREAGAQIGLSAVAAMVYGTTVGLVAWQALSGQYTAGELSVFIGAVATVQGTVSGIVQGASVAYEAVLMARHFTQLRVVCRTVEPPAAGTLQSAAWSSSDPTIRFQDVWFRYGDHLPWVLRGVDVVIESGRTTALVGVNGAGKSTFTKLLTGLYTPTCGRITWNGVDLRDLAPEALRERIACLHQDFMTYDLTAAQNIGLGRLDSATDSESVSAAAEAAGIDETLRRLPKGYATTLSLTHRPGGLPDEPDGTTLSGGQWQRVALARTMMRRDADLVVLDEPSAGLDAEAEAELTSRVHDLRRGRTSLLISHRLSSARLADRIVVLDGGAIAEQGTHDELVLAGGRYAHLFALQARGYQTSRTSPL
jgi:ATP-binding cassette subfamily B protein